MEKLKSIIGVLAALAGIVMIIGYHNDWGITFIIAGFIIVR